MECLSERGVSVEVGDTIDHVKFYDTRPVALEYFERRKLSQSLETLFCRYVVLVLYARRPCPVSRTL